MGTRISWRVFAWRTPDFALSGRGRCSRWSSRMWNSAPASFSIHGAARRFPARGLRHVPHADRQSRVLRIALVVIVQPPRLGSSGLPYFSVSACLQTAEVAKIDILVFAHFGERCNARRRACPRRRCSSRGRRGRDSVVGPGQRLRAIPQAARRASAARTASRLMPQRVATQIDRLYRRGRNRRYCHVPFGAQERRRGHPSVVARVWAKADRTKTVRNRSGNGKGFQHKRKVLGTFQRRESICEHT